MFNNFCHSTLGNSSPDTLLPFVLPSPPTEVTKRYSNYLRKVYLRCKLPVKGKLSPVPCKKIIKLAAIDIRENHSYLASCKLNRSESIDEYMQNHSMDSISMNDLLKEKDGILSKIVVVQGVPGIGKSTFAWKLCRKWAKGKIYQQYDLVVLLRMRDTRVQEATKLSDFIFSESKKQSEQVTENIIASGGKNILLLMEGIDELPVSCLADGTPLSNLLQGESLPEVTIIATSRPWAVQTLVEKCGDQISRQVEILGFTKDDILRYITYAFSEEEKADFLQYLESHPQLESIMHIPLNAAFIVQIYKQFRCTQQVIPNTLTELYTALVEGLLLRYMKSNADFAQYNVVYLKCLPEPVKTHFQQLCLLAFISFTKLTVQVTFTDSEAALFNCLDFLGLMQSSTELVVNTGTTVKHSFLHFTIQEFLAAYHLSNQPFHVQQLFLEVHINDPQFSVLITFLVGLNSNTLQFIPFPKSYILLPFHLHLLYESQSPQNVCLFLGVDLVNHVPTLTSTSFDLYSLSYCICHSNCPWALEIDIQNVSSLFSNSDQSYIGYLKYLVVSSASERNLRLLFSFPKRLFSNLHRLRINIQEPQFASILLDVLSDGRFTNLKSFSLTGNALQNSLNMASLFECLSMFHPKLVHIGIGLATFSFADMTKLCQYMKSRSGFPDFTLAVSGNDMDNESLRLMISTIAVSKSLTHLDLSNSCLSVELEMLSVAISVISSLRSLALKSCLIDGEGAELLCNELQENHTLLGLDLRNNLIDKNGAAALASMLAVNTSLKILYLSHNQKIGQVGALRLISTLKHDNKSIEKLTLPAVCEPIEYGSMLFKKVQKRNCVEFISETSSLSNTIAHQFVPLEVWPYR